MNLSAFIRQRRPSEIRSFSGFITSANPTQAIQSAVAHALAVFSSLNPDFASTNKGLAAGALYQNQSALKQAIQYLYDNATVADRNAQGQFTGSATTPPATAAAVQQLQSEIDREQTIFDHTAATAAAPITNITTTTATQVNPTITANVDSPNAKTTVTTTPQTVSVPQDISSGNTTNVTTPVTSANTAPTTTPAATTTETTSPATTTPVTTTPAPTSSTPTTVYVQSAAPVAAGTDTGYLQSQPNTMLYAIGAATLLALVFFHEKR